MAHEPRSITADDRVTWFQLLAYGLGGLIPIALFNIAGQLMGLLGNISLGLSAFWLGTIMIVPKLWDALSDPIIGYVSDSTPTRWGRRRPFILVGGVAVAISFVAMWWVPSGEWIRRFFVSESSYNWFRLGFILIGLLVFFTSCNLFEIPHGALGMEMSSDYHERTRLFSAKSFLGNLFAMGTPWLLFLADLKFFRGTSGNLTDGMRYVSMFIAAMLIPMAYWWFLVLKEPRVAAAEMGARPDFWQNLRVTMGNRTFLGLVAIIFTLAMGFNFVSLFSYYITIFYLYSGNAGAATQLLGVAGTVWAVTALVAVFPLNWLSKRLGKNWTLLLAILLMCTAQLAKIRCYDPSQPYLVLIPTALLSAGMLMFFTLGSSMVADVCDLDELNTGIRSEGTYYSVYWWFIKMGTAFASFVTGALLVFSAFDETQNVAVDTLQASAAVMKSEAESWLTEQAASAEQIADFRREIEKLAATAKKLRSHFDERINEGSSQMDHMHKLSHHLESLQATATALGEKTATSADASTDLVAATNRLLDESAQLKKQSPLTLFRLRLVEIGLPLVLSVISIAFTLAYPLTEARCYEIKAALEKRRAAVAF